MINLQDIKPIKRKVLVRKCTNGEIENKDGQKYYWKGNIVIPQDSGEFTNWAIILNTADDCRIYGKHEHGQYVLCPEHSELLWRIDSNHFMVHESALDGFVIKRGE